MIAKKQKRFNSEEKILKAIDAVTKLSQEALSESDKLRAELKSITIDKFKTERGWMDAVGWNKKQTEKAEKRACRYQDKKKKLGEALSRFRTILLPMPSNEDNSVTL